MDAIAFASHILCLAERNAFSVTSWGRTQHHNDSLPGSVKDSQHIKWLAVDIVRDPDCNKAALIADCEKRGLQCIDEADHIHIQVPR